jgi:hypothetical protein
VVSALVSGIPVCTAFLLVYLLETVELDSKGMQFSQTFWPESSIGFRRPTNFARWNAVEKLYLSEGKSTVEYGKSRGREAERVNRSSFENYEIACRFIAEHLPPAKVDPDIRQFLDLEEQSTD